MKRSVPVGLVLVSLLSACAGAYVPAGAPGAPGDAMSAGAVRSAPTAGSWAEADARALSAPAGLERDPAALAAWLTRGARDDSEKARAIFRWLTEHVAYDVDGLADPQAIRPEEVLTRGRSICDGYASAFELLGRLAGLEVATIHGYAKGYDYQPGQSFARPNHAWNAVRVGGRWRLIDSTWGAGYVTGGRFVKQLDDFFFLSDPAALAFTHLPADGHWALVGRPLSLGEFVAQPAVRPAFFRAGFSAADAADAIGRGGPVEVFLPPDDPIRFRAAPAQRVLSAGATYRFEVEAPADATVLLVNGGRWHRLPGAHGVFAGSIRPRSGELFVTVGPRGARGHRTVLRYQVLQG